MAFIVCGLGNPGSKYAGTPHNAGFAVVEHLVEDLGTSWSSKFGAQIATGKIRGEQIYFVKPLSFMNLSGGPLKQVAQYYKVAPEHIIVVHDDIDLEFGVIKTKIGGGNAGHNGLKSIQAAFGTPEFWRIRVGVGRDQGSPADYVLRKFTGSRLKDFEMIVSDAANIVEDQVNIN
ncbi:peptidyl-tRNA hydrolase [Actinomycetota bacterium]|nr:peptidyl-tRNA hydrolase [Actinomycetota bacterium]